LRAGVRHHDAVGRYGGEEFLAVLSGIGIDVASQVAERIRSEICNTPILFGGHAIPVTCSIGCAASAITATEEIPAIIEHADHALYRAKSSGRNRVEAEPSLKQIASITQASHSRMPLPQLNSIVN
jgi:diguanylate cyclase (GGDEF)-like protein